MKITMILCGVLCSSVPVFAQGSFDPILTYPPSPGPAYIDTGRYVDPVYKPTLSNADFRIKTHSTAKKRKLSDKEEYEKSRKEEDKAWQDFINKPASMETKMAPKYINTKTGK
jgi:hypothetical protein